MTTRRASAFTAEDVLGAFADAAGSARAHEWLDRGGFHFSNKTKEREQKRRWYLERRQEILARLRERRLVEPEAIRAIYRRYHKRHKERRNAEHRDYYQRNAERLRAARRAYYARQKSLRIARSTTPTEPSNTGKEGGTRERSTHAYPVDTQ